ncbi:unnamed protein product [Clonostachys byssicola]|uniref:Uncharacterized protein n=1 Tax=Clonostachys byssicola TaxID=160290 RepID=A0A9N9U2W6_9HYPO|nr:unnamed protein product [Clonostachys byssicola]
MLIPYIVSYGHFDLALINNHRTGRYFFGAAATTVSSGRVMEPGEEGEDILYRLGTECEGLFEDVHDALESAKSATGLDELCSDFQQRFAIWTAHLGVFAPKNQCLDTRLRNFPDLQDVTVRLLDLLRRCLYQWKSATDSAVEENIQHLQVTLHGIDDTLARLNNLGVTIRQSSADKVDLKAKKLASGSNSTLFRYLSAQAVQTLYPGASQALKDWLVQFMTVRWGRVMHLSKRNEVLSKRRVTHAAMDTIPEVVPDLLTFTTQRPQKFAHASDVPLTSRPKFPLAPSGQSDLSSINIQHIWSRNKPPDELSTRIAKTMSVQIKQGNYPKPPGNDMGSNYFPCPWCSELIDRRLLTDNAWRDCAEADKGYPNFSQWFEHMQLHDRRWHQKFYPTLTWICTVCETDSHVYDTPQSLYSHLQESHLDEFTEPQLQTISRQSKKEQERVWDDCLLCLFTVEGDNHPEHEAGQKRQKGPLTNDHTKSLRTSLAMRSAGSHGHTSVALAARPDSDTDSDSSSDSETPESSVNKGRSIAVARHIASHLQMLMLLTLRFTSLMNDSGNDDEVNSESVECDEEENLPISDPTNDLLSDLDDDMGTASLPDAETDKEDDIRNDNVEVPDCDIEIRIPSRYDGLTVKDDHFLQGVLQSGAYQSWRDSHDGDESHTVHGIEDANPGPDERNLERQDSEAFHWANTHASEKSPVIAWVNRTVRGVVNRLFGLNPEFVDETDQEVNPDGLAKTKDESVNNVKKDFKGTPAERFFKNNPKFIEELAEKAASLADDPTTPICNKDLLPKTVQVTMHQNVIYCGI